MVAGGDCGFAGLGLLWLGLASGDCGFTMVCFCLWFGGGGGGGGGCGCGFVGSGRDTTRKNVYCNEKKTIIITLESLK